MVHADPFPILAVCHHSHTSMHMCLRIPCSTCHHVHLLDMSSHILSRLVLWASDAPDLDCQKRQLQPSRAWSESWAMATVPSLPGQLDRRIFISSECEGEGEVILPCNKKVLPLVSVRLLYYCTVRWPGLKQRTGSKEHIKYM